MSDNVSEDVRGNLRGVLLVLDAAAQDGITLPARVGVPSSKTARMDLLFRTGDQVRAWASWRGQAEQVTTERRHSTFSGHRIVTEYVGEMYDALFLAYAADPVQIATAGGIPEQATR